MAIPGSGFSLITVRDEFAPQSRPGASLANYLSAVSLLSGANDRLTNFANTGKPTCSTMTAQVSGESITLRGNLSNLGGARCSYYWRYRQGTSGSWLLAPTAAGIVTNVTTTGTKTGGISLPPGTYQYQFMVFNGFNHYGTPASNEHTSGGTQSFTVATPSQPAINISSIFSNVGFQEFEFRWTQNTPRSTVVQLEISVDGGSWRSVGYTPSYNINNSTHIHRFSTAPQTPISEITIRLTGTRSGYPPVTALRNFIAW